MTLSMVAVCERVRLEMGFVSIILCTLGGARSMEGTWTVCDEQLVHLDLQWVFAVLVWPVALE